MTPRPAIPRAMLALVAACAVCSMLVLSACSTSTSTSGDFSFTSATKLGALMPVAERKKAQNFSGELISGGTTTLARARGKVTVVNFFASWCAPCQVETPQLALMSQQVKPRGVHFLGIDIKDDKGPATSFLNSSGVAFPVVFDQEGKTPLTLGNISAPGPPFTVLIDRQGKVAAVYLGQVTIKDLQGPIDKLLAER